MMDPLTALRMSSGLVLFTGPTGSGKNAVVMGCLQAMDLSALSAATIELAPRVALESVQQTVVSDLSEQLPMLLRLLDLDTDLIYVRELTDAALIEHALQAAQSRRLISTLHTHSSTDALGRLAESGATPWLIVEAVRVVQAQRWVRRLCPTCKRATTISGSAIGQEGPVVVFEPVGCGQCREGFRGRRLATERFALDHSPLGLAIRRGFLDGLRGEALHQAAREAGLVTLRESGISWVLRGETSVQEVLLSTPA